MGNFGKMIEPFIILSLAALIIATAFMSDRN